MYQKKNCICAVLIIFCIFFFTTGCKNDQDKDAYQGVGKLIVQRHKARVAQSAGIKKQTDYENSTSVPEGNDTLQDTILEEKVNIISVSSGKIIAKATAYLDGKGRIINIEIKRD